jgi:hypothetical protein
MRKQRVLIQKEIPLMHLFLTLQHLLQQVVNTKTQIVLVL